MAEFKYDVAFSFLARDEALADRLNDLLSDRLTTFLYSKKQEDLAGKDGELAFGSVFGSEARVVVVMYREGWGTTPWTRIEETALRNRAYEQGYDFAIFIPLDDPPTVPKYLPRNRMWVGLDRWGERGAATVIEARVQESGGSPRPETVAAKGARLAREIRAEEERQAYLRTKEAVDAANKELATAFSEIEDICASISDPSAGLAFRVQRAERDLAILGHGYSVTVSLALQWSNSMDHSSVHVTLWEGSMGVRGRLPFEDPKEVRREKFDFDRAPSGALGWRPRGRNASEMLSTHRFAQSCVDTILERVRRDMRKRAR